MRSSLYTLFIMLLLSCFSSVSSSPSIPVIGNDIVRLTPYMATYDEKVRLFYPDEPYKGFWLENLKEEALQYHRSEPKGKLGVVPTKPYATQHDLSMAYTPGVAVPCMEIYDTPEKVYDYTGKGNLVAVISNGTAVLGLGNIGAEASKPVMEGKGLLFKVLAGVNTYDIEIGTEDVEAFVQTVKMIAPTFGGINLEDIKAPQCFEIERRLKEEVNLPLMHDDQHGTAIITSAALLNALEIAGKRIV